MLTSYYEKRGTWREGVVFRSKGYSQDWCIAGQPQGTIAMASVPPFLRTLLVTDGTVTKSLEAYYWEPVQVDAVSNALVSAGSDIDWLDVRAGEEVLARSVLLRGNHSKTLYASAFSIIRLSLIPDELKAKLLRGELGIGELIRECGLESYRELLEFGQATDMSLFGGPETNQDCLFRTYRITIAHQPAMLISECFPLSVYSASQRVE